MDQLLGPDFYSNLPWTNFISYKTSSQIATYFFLIRFPQLSVLYIHRKKSKTYSTKVGRVSLLQEKINQTTLTLILQFMLRNLVASRKMSAHNVRAILCGHHCQSNGSWEPCIHSQSMSTSCNNVCIQTNIIVSKAKYWNNASNSLYSRIESTLWFATVKSI